MAAVCPTCGTSLGDVLQEDVPEEVQERLLELHQADATKIDHVRRGDAQECWACGESTKGFHLYKSGSDFIKLCDRCATHVATLLAHLVADEQTSRRGEEEQEEDVVDDDVPPPLRTGREAAEAEEAEEEAEAEEAEEEAEAEEAEEEAEAEEAEEEAAEAEEEEEPAEEDAKKEKETVEETSG